MTLGSVSIAALVPAMSAVLVLGVVAAARRAALPRAAVTRLGASLAAALATWLALTFLLAERGVFRVFGSAPPRLMLLPIGALVTTLVLSRTPLFRRLTHASPLWWPVALQSFRLLLELIFLRLHREGVIPEQMTFEGRNLDILVGLSAPFMALFIARWRAGRGPILAYNLVSLGLLLNIVGIAVTSFPGPLDAHWSGGSSAAVANPPFVWIPALLVPLAFFGHVVSLQQIASLARRRG